MEKARGHEFAAYGESSRSELTKELAKGFKAELTEIARSIGSKVRACARARRERESLWARLRVRACDISKESSGEHEITNSQKELA